MKNLLLTFEPIFSIISDRSLIREQSRHLPYDSVAELCAAKFGALRIPIRLGGGGVSFSELSELLIRLGEADSNVQQIFRSHFGFVEDLLTREPDNNIENWLLRVSDGEIFGAAMAERSDSMELKICLARNGNSSTLNGEKYYCTGSLFVDWLVVSAIDNEKPISIIVSRRADGVNIHDDWDGFGQRMSASGTVIFNNVVVSSSHILSAVRGPSYTSSLHQHIHLCNLTGIARAALRESIAHAKAQVDRHTSLISDPLVQRIIGRMASLVYSCETLVSAVANSLDTLDQPEHTDLLDPSCYIDCKVATFKSQQIIIQNVLEICTIMFDIDGIEATRSALQLDRYWRNARTLSSHNPAISREANLGKYYLTGSLDPEWRSKQSTPE